MSTDASQELVVAVMLTVTEYVIAIYTVGCLRKLGKLNCSCKT